MARIQSFRDLVAWQKAMDLADMVYELTEHFPGSVRNFVCEAFSESSF
jgi:23S rRNA-intervening sequence protein